MWLGGEMDGWMWSLLLESLCDLQHSVCKMAGWVKRGHPCQWSWVVCTNQCEAKTGSLAFCPNPPAVGLNAVCGWMPAEGEVHTKIWAGRLFMRHETKWSLLFLQFKRLMGTQWRPTHRQGAPFYAHTFLPTKNRTQPTNVYEVSSVCETLDWDGCLLNKSQWTINKILAKWI